MPWSTVSSLASCTWSSACFMVRITCSSVLKSPNPSCTSLVRCLLYKLSTISSSQHPCLTPLPVMTYLFPVEKLTPRDLNGGVVTFKLFCTQRKHPTCVFIYIYIYRLFKKNNFIVFPFAFRIAVQHSFKPL